MGGNSGRLAAVFLGFLLAGAGAGERVRPLMREFVGINGHFDFRPELYRQVCGLARNYHNMNWDVAKPGDALTLPVCPNGVNWERDVYGKWVRAGFEVSLCAQFGRFGEGNPEYLGLWEGQEAWMYDYGYGLAEAFGPSGERKLITSIEIGNEPGSDFDDGLYRRLYVQMARGIRAADPAVRIVTATARSGEADRYAKSLEETFAGPEMAGLIDVINVHVYAEKERVAGRSPWERSYPEDPEIGYLREVDAVLAFRDAHIPEAEVWITEFGYDACTPGAMDRREGWAAKLNWAGVSDVQQAQYLVRSLLCFAEREVGRAYIYYYNDEDVPSVHASSGLTRHFEPKPSFWAVRHFYRMLGAYRFVRVVRREAGRVQAVEFEHGEDAGRRVWVVWSPTGEGREERVVLEGIPGRVVGAERMPLADGDAPGVELEMLAGGDAELAVTGSPVYLEIEAGEPVRSLDVEVQEL